MDALERHTISWFGAIFQSMRILEVFCMEYAGQKRSARYFIVMTIIRKHDGVKRCRGMLFKVGDTFESLTFGSGFLGFPGIWTLPPKANQHIIH